MTNYTQEYYFLYTSQDTLSNGVRNLNLQGNELKDWAVVCQVSLRTAQRWFTNASDRINLVPPLVDFETRLDACKRMNRQEQYRLLGGLLWNGEITKDERLHGLPQTSRIPAQSYAYAVQKAWSIMTHQPTNDYLGKTFTSISIEKVDDVKNPWRVVVKYNDPENGVSPDLKQFPTNDKYKGMQSFFFDSEIPNDAIFD